MDKEKQDKGKHRPGNAKGRSLAPKKSPLNGFYVPSIETQLELAMSKSTKPLSPSDIELKRQIGSCRASYADAVAQENVRYVAEKLKTLDDMEVSNPFTTAQKHVSWFKEHISCYKGMKGALLRKPLDVFVSGSYADEVCVAAMKNEPACNNTKNSIDLVVVVPEPEESEKAWGKITDFAPFVLVDTYLAVFSNLLSPQQTKGHTDHKKAFRMSIDTEGDMRHILVLHSSESEWNIKIHVLFEGKTLQPLFDNIEANKQTIIKSLWMELRNNLADCMNASMAAFLLKEDENNERAPCHSLPEYVLDKYIYALKMSVLNTHLEALISTKYFTGNTNFFIFKAVMNRLGLYPSVFSGYELRLIFSYSLNDFAKQVQDDVDVSSSFGVIKAFIHKAINGSDIYDARLSNGVQIKLDISKSQESYIKETLEYMISLLSGIEESPERVFLPEHRPLLIPYVINLDISDLAKSKTHLEHFMKLSFIPWLCHFYPLSGFTDIESRLMFKFRTDERGHETLTLSCLNDSEKRFVNIIDENTITDMSNMFLGPKGNVTSANELSFRYFWNSSLHRGTLREAVAIKPYQELRLPLCARVLFVALEKIFRKEIASKLAESFIAYADKNVLNLEKGLMNDLCVKGDNKRRDIRDRVEELSQSLNSLTQKGEPDDARSVSFIVCSVRPSSLIGYGLLYETNQDAWNSRHPIAPIILHYSGTYTPDDMLTLVEKHLRAEGCRTSRNTIFIDVIEDSFTVRLILLHFPSGVSPMVSECCLGASALLNKIMNAMHVGRYNKELFEDTVLLTIGILRKSACIPLIEYSPNMLIFARQTTSIFYAKESEEKDKFLKGKELLALLDEVKTEKASQDKHPFSPTSIGMLPIEVILMCIFLALRDTNQSATLHENLVRVFEFLSGLDVGDVYNLNGPKEQTNPKFRNAVLFKWEMDPIGLMFTRSLTPSLLLNLKQMSVAITKCLLHVSACVISPQVLFTPVKSILTQAEAIIVVSALSPVDGLKAFGIADNIPNFTRYDLNNRIKTQGIFTIGSALNVFILNKLRGYPIRVLGNAIFILPQEQVEKRFEINGLRGTIPAGKHTKVTCESLATQTALEINADCLYIRK